MKTEKCMECESKQFLECPICKTYRCECCFGVCEKCNSYHCFRSHVKYTGGSKCGSMKFVHAPGEASHHTFMEFEHRDYVTPKGKKVLHCRVGIEKIKCVNCDYSKFPNEWDFDGDCKICKANICSGEDCSKQCKECYSYMCLDHKETCPCIKS